MLYLVEMQVTVPAHLSDDAFEALKTAERDYAQSLMRKGVWKHIWRVAGAYRNVSVFDVEDHQELHEILSALPFFPFLSTDVTPLVPHPSAINPGDDRQ